MNRVVPFFALLAACKPPVEAPAEIGALTQFLYANFHNEEGEELIAGAPVLETYMLGLALDGDADARAVTLPILLPESLGTVSQPEGVDPLLQVPVGLSARSTFDYAANKGLIAEPNQVCIASDSTKYAMRTYTTDLACFMDGSCDSVSSVAEVRRETILANIWYDWYEDFRTVTLDDGREATFGKGWITQRYLADDPDKSWDQIFTINVWIPDADGATTLRFYGMWSSVTLGLGDDAYASLVKSGIDEGFSNADNFLSGGDCDNDRDRENDRP